MRNEIAGFIELLAKYSNIEFIALLTKELKTLLKEDNPSFNQVITIFTRYPLIDLIPFFPQLDKQDVVNLKKAVVALLDAAKVAWLSEFENQSGNEMALYCAQVIQDNEFLQGIKFNTQQQMTIDKSKVIKEFSNLPAYLLMVGQEKLTPDFLQSLARIELLKFSINKVTKTEADDDQLLLSNFALFNTHFVELPLDELIEHFNIRFDCIAVRTNHSIQYQPGDGFYYELQPPPSNQTSTTVWDFKKIPLESDTPKLLSLNITNCHTVLIHEAKTNRVWMLHVSPGSLNGIEPLGNVPTKLAYTDLQPHYGNNPIGVSEQSQLEIYVIDARGNFNESLLRKRLPTQHITLTHVATGIHMPPIYFSSEEEKHKYHVCYDPIANNLMIKQKNHTQLITDLFKKQSVTLQQEKNSKSEQLEGFGLFSSSPKTTVPEEALSKNAFIQLIDSENKEAIQSGIKKILANPISFKNCIVNYNDLFWAMKFASSEQQNQLIAHIRDNPDEYKRLITTKGDLYKLEMCLSKAFYEQLEQKYDEYHNGGANTLTTK